MDRLRAFIEQRDPTSSRAQFFAPRICFFVGIEIFRGTLDDDLESYSEFILMEQLYLFIPHADMENAIEVEEITVHILFNKDFVCVNLKEF